MLFLPFIELIEEKMEVMELEAAKDYRLDRLLGEPLYFTPLGSAAAAGILEAFRKLTGVSHGVPQHIVVKGRTLPCPIPRTALRASPSPSCAGSRSARIDYRTIARHFHTLIVEDVPILSRDRRDEARRFNTLIDTLYDYGTGLIVSAAAEPDALYAEGDGADLFRRTASRLMEMRSEGYLTSARNKRQVQDSVPDTEATSG